jgi:uncharacterized protein (TIGR02172 family)
VDSKSSSTAGSLVIELPPRLDIGTVASVEHQLQIDGIQELILDFRNCHYVSSAGIRTILQAHKTMAKTLASMVAINVPPAVAGIFEMTGLSELIRVRKKPREISMEGLELLSAGVCGECYRVDRETVVKLYHEGVNLETAEQEKKYARAAFIMGIPTAISYDLVACGSRSGVVYEMLDAELLSSVIRNDPDNVDRYAKTLSDVLKTVNAAKGDPAVLPDLKNRFRGYMEQMAGYLPAQDIEILKAKLEALPEANTCVHFDLHTSNVMIRNGEPVIIDMGDFSIGTYLFDLGLIYMIYGVPELNLSMLATRLPVDLGLAFWQSFEKHYFADRPSQDREMFHDNRYFLASLRLIFTITFLPKLRADCVRWLEDILLPKLRTE